MNDSNYSNITNGNEQGFTDDDLLDFFESEGSSVPSVQPSNRDTSTGVAQKRTKKSISGGAQDSHSKKFTEQQRPQVVPFRGNVKSAIDENELITSIVDTEDAKPFESLSPATQVAVLVKNLCADAEQVLQLMQSLRYFRKNNIRIANFEYAMNRFGYPEATLEEVEEGLQYEGVPDSLLSKTRRTNRGAFLFLHVAALHGVLLALQHEISSVKLKEKERCLEIIFSDFATPIRVSSEKLDMFGTNVEEVVGALTAFTEHFPGAFKPDSDFFVSTQMASYVGIKPVIFQQVPGQQYSPTVNYALPSFQSLIFDLKDAGEVPLPQSIIGGSFQSVLKTMSMDQYFRNTIHDVGRTGAAFIFRCFSRMIEHASLNTFFEVVRRFAASVKISLKATLVQRDVAEKSVLQMHQAVLRRCMDDEKIIAEAHDIIRIIDPHGRENPKQLLPYVKLFISQVPIVQFSLKALFKKLGVIDAKGFNPRNYLSKCISKNMKVEDQLFHMCHSLNRMAVFEQKSDVGTPNKFLLSPEKSLWKGTVASTLGTMMYEMNNNEGVAPEDQLVFVPKSLKNYLTPYGSKKFFYLSKEEDTSIGHYKMDSSESFQYVKHEVVDPAIARWKAQLRENPKAKIGVIICTAGTVNRTWIEKIVGMFKNKSVRSGLVLYIQIRAHEFAQNASDFLFPIEPNVSYPSCHHFILERHQIGDCKPQEYYSFKPQEPSVVPTGKDGKLDLASAKEAHSMLVKNFLIVLIRSCSSLIGTTLTNYLSFGQFTKKTQISTYGFGISLNGDLNTARKVVENIQNADYVNQQMELIYEQYDQEFADQEVDFFAGASEDIQIVQQQEYDDKHPQNSVQVPNELPPLPSTSTQTPNGDHTPMDESEDENGSSEESDSDKSLSPRSKRRRRNKH